MRKLMHFRTLLIWPAFLILLRRETWRGTVPAAGANRSESKRSEDAEQGDGAKQSQLGRNEAKSSGGSLLAEQPAGHRRRQLGAEAVPAERFSRRAVFPPSGSRRAVPAERHEKRGLESRNGCNALCRVRLARISRRSRHQHHKRVSFCPTRRKSREVVALRPEIRRHPPPSLP